MLEAYIREKRRQKALLLMTHIVIGYPSLEASEQLVDTMVAAGVDLMELQIPFSEPIADGPVILRANQEALAGGVSVAQCLAFGRRMAEKHAIPFLFMTYFNILHKYGLERFTWIMAESGLHGAIVPDLPPEEGADYLSFMASRGLAPIFIFAPTTPPERLEMIARHARGFVYCVARKGVTGQNTEFSHQLDDYLARCRQATGLPLALGFGVKDKTDIDFLTGKADIAVIGTETIRRMDQGGTAAVSEFIRGLQAL
jgi:tryptophan synthase alpha chain